MRSMIGYLLILSLAFAAEAAAQTRTYALDEDPIRLGNKALDSGNISTAKSQFQKALDEGYQMDRAQFGLARVAVGEGQFEDAEPLFRLAIEAHRAQENKGYPEAEAGLGLLLLRFDRRHEARELFASALDQKDKLWEAIYGQARLELLEEEWNAAKKLLARGEKLSGAPEGEDKYHFGMALYHLGRGEIETAETEALRAFHLNPADPSYGVLVGEIYERRNAPTLAIDALEKAMASPGFQRTAPLMHTLGGLYHRVERYTEARDSYLQAAQIDSTYAPALRDLADLFAAARQHDRAARTYLRYVLLVRDDVEALLGLASSCYEVQRFEQSVEAARSVLDLEADSADARFALARAGIHSRDAASQAEAAGLMSRLSPDLPWAAQDLVALANFQARSKQYGTARSTLERAKAMDAERSDVYFQLGILDLRTGQPAAAIQNFEQAIARRADNPLYHLNLGIAHFQAGQQQAAIAPIRTALELNEELTVGRLLLAQALAASDALDEAALEYKKILNAEPKNAKALRGLGFCQIRGGDFVAAARSYQAATDADPQSAEAWAGLGNAHLSAEAWDEAERAFERARALDPQNATMKKGLEILSEARGG